jgi:hypothetical protein
VLGQDAADGLGAASRGVAGELVVDGAGVEDFEDFGLVEGPLELAVCDDFGEVEQGPGDCGDRDVVLDGDVLVGEGRRAVNEDALVLSAGAAGHGHLDPGVAVVAQLV